MKRLLPFALFLIPSVALALSFTNQNERYGDSAFFSRAESAGISVLTEIGAVEGNPDGMFHADRTLNRAEFAKIAARSVPNLFGPWIDTLDLNCFPDVKATDWFSRDICGLKKLGVVRGNPDGYFHPERPVNYVEAVKILVELYDYPVNSVDGDEWFQAYLRAAAKENVLIPATVANDAPLTRGQMARLAAAFVANAHGQLTLYRDFERGKKVAVSSSSSRSSDSSESSASSDSSSSQATTSASSSVSSVTAATFPAVSHFLIAGQTTPILFDGYVTSSDEDSGLQIIEIELRREVKGLDSLILVGPEGQDLATIPLQGYSNLDKTKWRVEVPTSTFIFTKDTPVRVGIKAKMKALGSGGTTNELMELKTWSIWSLGTVSNNSHQLVPTDLHNPFHQTAYGHVLGMRNGLATTMTVAQGNSRQLGTFTVNGSATSGGNVALESLTFLLQATNVDVSNVRIGGPNPGDQGSCAREVIDERITLTCLIPQAMRDITASPVTLSVYADLSVAVAVQTGTVHLSALGTGGIGSSGSIRWSDGITAFNWIESDAVLESGPVVTVTK